ncbi:MAG: hypothetical protein GY790_11820 [Bacteroidetes bacterium]|nr:hypothetical protein [Bacteroidota bacterium]
MNRSKLVILASAIMVCAGNSIWANVKIASVFSHHMVLQADRHITVWGQCSHQGRL